MSKRIWLKVAIGAASAVAMTGAAQAATATSSMSVTATVSTTCAVSATPLAFGTYAASTASTGSSTIGVTCTNGTAYSVGLDAGAGSGATTSNRLLTGSGGGTLAYTLYRDSGRTQNWGNTIGTDTQSGTGTGLAQTLNVYGRIAAGATALAGSYTDTVTVTLTY